MISAPLLTAGVQVDLPDSEAPPMNQQDAKPIEVTISDEGLYIGSTQVKRNRLVNLLKAMSDGDTGRRIYIRGGENLAYGRIMKIVGAINAAGFNKVALVSEPDTGQ
jgi:biopolymer transport protein TolR